VTTVERVADRLAGERPEAGDAEHPGPYPVLAQLVDRVLDGAEDRAEGDDDQLGVVGAVRANVAAALLARGDDIPEPPLGRPNWRAKSALASGISSRACRIRSPARKRTSVNASGPTMAPIDTGSAGSST
jgi:hypothetical protein